MWTDNLVLCMPQGSSGHGDQVCMLLGQLLGRERKCQLLQEKIKPKPQSDLPKISQGACKIGIIAQAIESLG